MNFSVNISSISTVYYVHELQPVKVTAVTVTCSGSTPSVVPVPIVTHFVGILYIFCTLIALLEIIIISM